MNKKINKQVIKYFFLKRLVLTNKFVQVEQSGRLPESSGMSSEAVGGVKCTSVGRFPETFYHPLPSTRTNYAKSLPQRVVEKVKVKL